MSARELKGSLERRGFTSRLELREEGDSPLLRFSGYASVFDSAYPVGDFEEVIERGAFKRTLSESRDVVLTLDHGRSGSGLPLARTTSGTLSLEEDERGLLVSASLDPSDPDVALLRPKMARGDVNQMSFAFRATADSWNAGRTLRTVRGVTLNHGDVRVVTSGANAQTEALLRSRPLRRPALLDHTTRARQEWELAALRSGVPLAPIVREDAATQRQRAQLAALKR